MSKTPMIHITLLFLSLLLESSQAAQVYILGDNVNARYEPSISSIVAFQINKGAKIEIERRQQEWSRIFLSNEHEKKGWVLSDFIGSWHVLQMRTHYGILRDLIDQSFKSILYYQKTDYLETDSPNYLETDSPRTCHMYNNAKAAISEINGLSNSIRQAFSGHLPKWYEELPNYVYTQMEAMRRECE